MAHTRFGILVDFKCSQESFICIPRNVLYHKLLFPAWEKRQPFQNEKKKIQKKEFDILSFSCGVENSSFTNNRSDQTRLL